jgi:hypothetical protein
VPRFEETAKEFLLAAKIEAFFDDVSRDQSASMQTESCP